MVSPRLGLTSAGSDFIFCVLVVVNAFPKLESAIFAPELTGLLCNPAIGHQIFLGNPQHISINVFHKSSLGPNPAALLTPGNWSPTNPINGNLHIKLRMIATYYGSLAVKRRIGCASFQRFRSFCFSDARLFMSDAVSARATALPPPQDGVFL